MHPTRLPPRPIVEIAHQLGLRDEEFELHGSTRAKVRLDAIDRHEALAAQAGRRARHVLVTGITPTASGEGKTTTTIGLAQGLQRLGHRAAVCLRQPSIGQVMGLRGGAAGGGRCRIEPPAELDLGLAGDSLSVAAAHNLAAAFVENSLRRGNPLGIDPDALLWPRATDINDRALRRTMLGADEGDGSRRTAEWVSTMASEVMAILILAPDSADLRARLRRIVVAKSLSGTPITAEALRAAGAMAVLLRDAACPNLLQTSEGVPAFVHGGSFAHVAPGTSSILADRLALATSDIVCTEAGYGSDLGAEKFFDLRCRRSGRAPDAVVIVASVRALKVHGGRSPARAGADRDVAAVRRGSSNLAAHVGIIRQFGVPVVVAINAFPTDDADEIQAVREAAIEAGAAAAVPSDHYRHGGEGALELAETVWRVAAADPVRLQLLYADEQPLADKIEVVARRVYGAADVDFSAEAKRQLAWDEAAGFGNLAVCMVKTPYSLSADPGLLGRPSGFAVAVREVRLAAGAGYVMPFLGPIPLLPELPEHPRGERMDVADDGAIVGLDDG